MLEGAPDLSLGKDVSTDSVTHGKYVNTEGVPIRGAGAPRAHAGGRGPQIVGARSPPLELFHQSGA
eukprot:5178974-Pyramimonas_sp.AAC.1